MSSILSQGLLPMLAAITLVGFSACSDSPEDPTEAPLPEETDEIPPFDPEKRQLFFVLSLEQTTEFLKNHPDTKIIDIRPPADYEAGHLPGARSVDFMNETFQPRMGVLPRELRYPVVGDGVALGGQSMTVFKAIEFRNIYILSGGFPAWQEAGLPVETGPDSDPLPVPPPPPEEEGTDEAA